MSMWLLVGAFLAGWSTCFIGWLISRDAVDPQDDVDATVDVPVRSPSRSGT